MRGDADRAASSRRRCSTCGCRACRSAWAGCARSRTCSARRTARSSRTRSARPTRSGRWIAAPTCRCCGRSCARPRIRPRAAKVAELRRRLAELKARSDAGRWKEVLKATQAAEAEARALGYQPLVAEILLAGGRGVRASRTTRRRPRRRWSRRSGRRTRPATTRCAPTAATELVFVFGYQEGQFDEAERWSGTAEAVLQRLGGHELLRAWQLNNIGRRARPAGRARGGAAAQQQALALKEKALGRDHPDVGISEGNIAVELAGLARNQEALDARRSRGRADRERPRRRPSRRWRRSSTTGARSWTRSAASARRGSRSNGRASSGSASSASTIATSPTR